MVFRFFYIIFAISFARAVDPEWTRFSLWLQKFKIIAESESHLGKMFHNWVDNNEFIQEINERNLSYTLGHNQFSGMNREEFREYLLRSPLLLEDRPTIQHNFLREKSSPASVDWVKAGAVTPVKDQGQCGSCWSFSTTGALEGAFFNRYGKLQSFSEQQLVDCDMLRNGGKDHGCKGGLMDNAFSWIQKNGGLCLESEYPYVSGATQTGGECKTTCDVITGSDVQGYVDVEPSSETAFLSALSKTPLAVAIEADQREFQLYKSGVFTGTCGTKLDHGVLAVGYAEDYILVKNSWSTSWGDGGYIKLARGAQYNGADGQCGVFMEASYPLL
jgi:C1A family cysteine protease